MTLCLFANSCLLLDFLIKGGRLGLIEAAIVDIWDVRQGRGDCRGLLIYVYLSFLDVSPNPVLYIVSYQLEDRPLVEGLVTEVHQMRRRCCHHSSLAHRYFSCWIRNSLPAGYCVVVWHLRVQLMPWSNDAVVDVEFRRIRHLPERWALIWDKIVKQKLEKN